MGTTVGLPAKISRGSALECVRLVHSRCGNGGLHAGRIGTDTRWQKFCSNWNVVLTNYPIPMVIFYRGVCTVTWAVIFHALCASSIALSALAHPNYAVGWLVMQSTVKLRQPINAALAATTSNLVPALSLLKVSPLLVFFAADAKTKSMLGSARTSIEESPLLGSQGQELTKRCFNGFTRFVRWAEGPIDKYGFSYFLSAKFTGLLTLSMSTLAASHGLDISGVLSHWGFSSELQADAGLLACAAGFNTMLAPVHFVGAVRLAQFLEKQAISSWREEQRVKSHTPVERVPEEEDEQTESDYCRNLLSNMALLGVIMDVGFTVYIMKRLARAQTQTADSSPSSETEQSSG